MRKLVLDCSVSGAWFLPDERNEQSQRILEETASGIIEILVPELWLYESLNLIRSATLSNRISEPQAFQIIQLLRSVPMKLVTIKWEETFGWIKIALDHNLSVYDASYFYLAQSSGVDFITFDESLLRLKKKYPWIKDSL